jgi:hypothetical protein
MVRHAPSWIGLLAAAVVFAMASAAAAAVPPLKIASERQASLREAASDTKVDVSVTITAGELKSHAETGVALGIGKSLAFGDDGLLAWRVLSVVLTAKDPIKGLQEHVGQIDASKTSIETLDDGFVYVWGSSPQIALSRDLSRIRRVTARSGDHTWVFRLSGDLGVAGLPERVHILRSGKPYASVEIEQTPSATQD